MLFLVKVLEKSSFDGGIFVFIIGTPIIVVIIITQKKQRFSLLLQNINKFEDGASVFKQIRYFLELVDKKYKDRKSNILLKGYIYLHPIIGVEDDDDANENERKKLSTKVSNENNKKGKDQKIDSYQNIIFMIVSCVFGFFLSVVLTFQSNLDKMETYAELYNITSFESHSYLLVFDKLREYFFDPNALIKKEIETTLKGIYTYQKEES